MRDVRGSWGRAQIQFKTPRSLFFFVEAPHPHTHWQSFRHIQWRTMWPMQTKQTKSAVYTHILWHIYIIYIYTHICTYVDDILRRSQLVCALALENDLRRSLALTSWRKGHCSWPVLLMCITYSYTLYLYVKSQGVLQKLWPRLGLLCAQNL